jgi:transaldolase
MKIFLDTANIQDIGRYAYLIDGVTTNPSLLAREEGGNNLEGFIKKITSLINGPISVEVINQQFDGIINEARRISSIAPNIVVKIPMTPEGIRATSLLSKEGIQTNVTLIFSPNQAYLAAKAGATYVSIFVGRLDDIGHEGMEVVKNTLEIFKKQQCQSQVIVASIRHPIHVCDAATYGAHVVTIPPGVLDLMYNHPLTDIGLTRFLNDWKRASNAQ